MFYNLYVYSQCVKVIILFVVTKHKYIDVFPDINIINK